MLVLKSQKCMHTRCSCKIWQTTTKHERGKVKQCATDRDASCVVADKRLQTCVTPNQS